MTCLSDLNSAESLFFLLPVPSELKHDGKMLVLLTRISICCLESSWLCLLQQRWSLLSRAHGGERREGEKIDRPEKVLQPSNQQLQQRTSRAPTLQSAPGCFYNLGLSTFQGTRHKVSNVCRVFAFSLSHPCPRTHAQTAWLQRKPNLPRQAAQR